MVNDDGKINFANKDVLEYFDFDFNNKYYDIRPNNQKKLYSES